MSSFERINRLEAIILDLACLIQSDAEDPRLWELAEEANERGETQAKMLKRLATEARTFVAQLDGQPPNA